MTPGGPRVRQSKAVTIAYASLAAVILLVIAAIALVVVPPSPPSVSEFAPQAQEPIKDAPNQQSSQFGSGAGACAAGQICEGPDARAIAPPKKVVEKARVRRCVGDPPRQTEDPQSPPCVNYFEGNNGGATSKGVTRDEIRIVGRPFGNQWPAELYVYQLLAAYFNSRFEFYGRKLEVIETGASSSKPEAKRAQAVKVDEEIKAFASLDYDRFEYESSVYYDELARRKIISTSYATGYRYESRDFTPNRPYQWNYQPTLDETFYNVVEWACNGLVGRNAAFGGPQEILKRRKLGILVQISPTETTDLHILRGGLESCAGESVSVYEREPGATDSSRTKERLILATMKQDGVTSVICVCRDSAYDFMIANNSQQDYQPEWIIPGGIFASETRYEGLGTPTEHLLAVAGANKIHPVRDEPWYWAVKEMDPNFIIDWNAVWAWAVSKRYKGLLLLASGIQTAGPKLTPESFEAGLFKTKFPNPGCSAPPYFQACVGFGPGNHSMVSDMAMVWWDSTALPQDGQGGQGNGDWCYIERGVRYSVGQWPKEQPSFYDRTKPCR